MAVIATSKPQEDFIVQINGDYGIVFDEITAKADVVSGQVTGIMDTPAGIYAHDAKLGERVRIMVRGNPTTVNAQALTNWNGDSPKATLASAGIIVINE